jgi:hypothetical protein
MIVIVYCISLISCTYIEAILIVYKSQKYFLEMGRSSRVLTDTVLLHCKMPSRNLVCTRGCRTECHCGLVFPTTKTFCSATLWSTWHLIGFFLQ